MQKRAVGYVRQSDEKQRDNFSRESQEAAIMEYFQRIGYSCLGVEYEVQSGMDDLDARPVLRTIRERMARKEIDALVVYMVGRATRAGGIYALFLAHECNEAGVELHFANDGGRVDITTLVGQLTLLLKGDQAREERAHLLEAMERGRRTRAMRGYPLPGRSVRFGYRWVDKPDPLTGRVRRKAAVVIEESEAQIIIWIFEEYVGGKGIQKIADELNDRGVLSPRGKRWGIPLIQSILKDTRYIGEGYAYTHRHERLGYQRYKLIPANPEEVITLPVGT